MKAISRIVSTSFWEDEKIVNMFSPEDKYFYLYLLTNPHTTQLGIYVLVPKVAAFETGYSTEAIMVLLDRFENKYGMIRYSKETSEVAIKNYLVHSIVKGGKPVLDCLKKEGSQVKDRTLLQYIYTHLSSKKDINTTVKEYLDTVGIKENDNDNENERIVDDSWTIREKSMPEPKTRRFVKPTVDDIRAYCLERGNGINPEAFFDFYESKGWVVGKSPMKDWKAAIRTWEQKKGFKAKPKKSKEQDYHNGQIYE